MDALEHWTDFNVAMVGATAALAGLVIVASSVNIAQIVQTRSLTARLAAAITALVLALAASAVGLIPDIPLTADGIVVIVFALLANETPGIVVSGVPAGTVELALVMHDPDAPRPTGFTHWLRYGIAADAIDLSASPARDGVNDTGSTGYYGPRPPAGHGIHHYYFWVYALDVAVEGEPGREEFLARYGSHVIEQNRLVGTYTRA